MTQHPPAHVALSPVEVKLVTAFRNGWDIAMSRDELEQLLTRMRQTYELVVIMSNMAGSAYQHVENDVIATRQMLAELQIIAQAYFADPEFAARTPAPNDVQSIEADIPISPIDPTSPNVTHVDFKAARMRRPTTRPPTSDT